ncbi:MAG: hypothetical protein ACLVLH_17610 [Eisenbergiella massiliensis]
MLIIEQALAGNALPWASFQNDIYGHHNFRRLYGGEIVPSLFIGATFTVLSAPSNASLGAAVGMIAVSAASPLSHYFRAHFLRTVRF